MLEDRAQPLIVQVAGGQQLESLVALVPCGQWETTQERAGNKLPI